MEKLVQGNAAFVLDVLCGRLAFERTGVKLYDTVIHKIERQGEERYHAVLGPMRHIRDEEQEHATFLEETIRSLGGNPDELTSMKQLETEESMGIVSVIVDGHQRVIDLLHALLAAELADNAGWDVLVKLSSETGDRKAKAAFAKRLAEEAKHLLFIREAVIRAAEIELLGREQKLPSSFVGAMKKPIAIGGLLGAALLGAGALIASALFVAKPSIATRSRRLLGVC